MTNVPPVFYYENIVLTPTDVWEKILDTYMKLNQNTSIQNFSVLV